MVAKASIGRIGQLPTYLDSSLKIVIFTYYVVSVVGPFFAKVTITFLSDVFLRLPSPQKLIFARFFRKKKGKN